MKFEFDFIHELEPWVLNNVQFGHEPNNELVQYFVNDSNLQNRSALVPFGDYTDLVLHEESARFTRAKVSSFGVKSTVGIGAYGFYMDEEGKHGVVKVPINFTGGMAPPNLIVGQTDLTITYEIGNPDVVNYEAFRLVFRQGEFAYEFITYQLEGEVDKPFGMQGDFIVTCIGYKNEIQDYSQPTPPISINITKRSDDVEESAAGQAILLEAAKWDSNTITVEAEGVTPTSIVIVAPLPASQEAYTSYGILCVEQGDGILTFTCVTKPVVDINVGVVIL